MQTFMTYLGYNELSDRFNVILQDRSIAFLLTLDPRVSSSSSELSESLNDILKYTVLHSLNKLTYSISRALPNYDVTVVVVTLMKYLLLCSGVK